jgi:glutamate/tyrosine decarboxylase-like PLP-dependent enzyme
MPLPPKGAPPDEVLTRLEALRRDDRDWRAGRVFSLVYDGGASVHEVVARASELYLFENALNTDVFKSLRHMQHDILDITGGLLHGGGDAAGFMTSGGTESVLMAVKAAREWGAERGIHNPEVVLPTTAHAAFTKAGHYFGVRTVRVPVDSDYRADVSAMEDAVSERTVLLVASAPSYPQGVVDDVPGIAGIAARRGALCHVDACMGGFILPFLERLGRFDKPWDFRVEGVTSISADLHKYGYTAKGASAVIYRTKQLRRHQAFITDDWLGGVYGSPSMQGTRPAGPIAAAWAVLHHLGEDGYLRLSAAASDAASVLIDAIHGIEGLTVRGQPDATILSFGAAEGSDIDTFAIGDALATLGWYLDRQTPPDSLHATVHAGHAASVHELAIDLAGAAASGGTAGDRDTTYGTVD